MNNREKTSAGVCCKDTMRTVVRYWFRNAENYVIMAVAISAFFVLYNVIFNRMTPVEIVKLIVWATFFIGAGIVINYCMTAVSQYVPLAVSFGSTRKKAFMGQQVSLLALCVQVYIMNAVISAIGSRLTDYRLYQDGLLLWAGILLIVAGIGQIAAVISKKVNAKAAAAIIILLTMIVAFGVAGLGLLLEKGLSDLLEISAGLQGLALFFGVLLYLAGAKVSAGYVQKMTVIG